MNFYLGILFILGFIFIILLLSAWIGAGVAQKKVLKALTFVPPEKVRGPLVSIIIPALNEEKYLPRLIKSIKHQTYEDIETIVVDNLSTDETASVAREMGAVVITVAEKNLSLVRNKGAEKARGETLFFIDADSLIENSYVEKLVNALSDKVKLSHGGVCCYDSQAHGAYWIFNRWFKPRIYISGRNGICMRKNDFWAVGGYSLAKNPMEGNREDLDLGLRFYHEFGYSAIKYSPNTLIGSSARRERMFGYPLFDFPSAWGKRRKTRGVRGDDVIE
jgi:glycosyltransferase involved in cell wall biosynthesis